MSNGFSARQADMQVFNFTTMNCPIYFRQRAHNGEVRHVCNICSVVALMNYYFKYGLGPICNSL